MPSFSERQKQDIRVLIQQGRKIEAIKWVRDHSDLGLKDAKDYVENSMVENSMENPDIAASNRNLSQFPKQEILSLIRQDSKIEAIKLVMQHSSLGLKEAKNWVDNLAENPNLDFNHDLNDFPSVNDLGQPNDSIYKAIQTHLEAGEIFVLYQDGGKERIDENHPAWGEIMAQFGRGQSYDSAEQYLLAMKAQSYELNHHSDQTIASSRVPRSTAVTTQALGIEDQSQQKLPLLRWLVIIMVIVLIACAWWKA